MSNATATISMRVPESVKRDIQQAASEEHKSLTAFIIDAIYDVLEYEDDVRAMEEARQQRAEDPSSMTPHSEVMKEFGIA